MTANNSRIAVFLALRELQTAADGIFTEAALCTDAGLRESLRCHGHTISKHIRTVREYLNLS